MGVRPHTAAGHDDDTAHRYSPAVLKYEKNTPASASSPNNDARPMPSTPIAFGRPALSPVMERMIARHRSPISGNFVNRGMSRSALCRKVQRLVAQGFDEEIVRKVLAAENAASLVGQTAQHPVTTPTKITRKASITSRAAAAMKDRRIETFEEPTGRYRSTKQKVVTQFEALATIPGHDAWRLDVLISKRLQRLAYSQAERGAAHWLRCRLGLELRKRGLSVPMIFGVGIESRLGWNLHVHILGAVRPEDFQAVIDALAAFAEAPRTKAGKLKKTAEHRIKPKRAHAAEQALYVLKNAQEVEATGFVPGRALVVSQDV